MSEHKSLRYRLGQGLFNLADWLENIATDVSGMREALDAASSQTPEEVELSAHKRKLFVNAMLTRHRFPCPECEGKQYVKRGAAYVNCLECGGTGIDRLVAGQR